MQLALITTEIDRILFFATIDAHPGLQHISINRLIDEAAGTVSQGKIGTTTVVAVERGCVRFRVIRPGVVICTNLVDLELEGLGRIGIGKLTGSSMEPS